MSESIIPSTFAAASATAEQTQSTLTFADFGLHPDILRALAETGYTHPTPIQAQAIPVVMAGRDVMGAAQTGTGKTAAFTLPILQRLMPLANHSASPARHPVRALILTPTRELADQVADSVKRYSRYTPLRSAVVFGGVDIRAQFEVLRHGCEILIATPGRLLDHVEQRTVDLSQVSIFVLDEADRMLDMGFLPDLERISKLLPRRRQSLLFSATFSDDIRKLARNNLDAPVEIEVAARNATADTVSQIAYKLPSEAKRAVVAHLVKSRGLNQVIVFTNTKIGTARLARQLVLDGIKAESIHGDKSQADRMKALEAFKAGELEVLVATDVAARGLDVAGVPCVINYDLPYNPEDYVHRIGRTGRAGASGEAIALFSEDEEKRLIDVENLIGRKVPRGSLDLPAISRPSRAARTRSDERDQRRQRGNGRESYRNRGSAHTGPVDDIFFKPYQPAAPTGDTHRDPQSGSGRDNPASSSRRDVGVLLGGGRRKPS